MHLQLSLRAAGLSLALAVALPAVTQAAESVEEFYKKKNLVEVLIGYGPGSGFETWARVVVKHLSKHVPGNPTFIIKNMPGAGGLLMENFLYNQAPKDGSVIASLTPNAATQILLGGINNVNYDPRKFMYLGSVESPENACTMNATYGVTTPAEAQQKDTPMGAVGMLTPDGYMPPVINKMFNAKMKVVTGYTSSADVFLAVDRGEVAGTCSRLETALRNYPEQLKSGKFKFMFTLGPKRQPETPDTPSIY